MTTPRSSNWRSISILRRLSPASENPLLGPSASTLVEMGALRWSFLSQDHQKWHLLVFPCLHSGVVHLVTNLGGIILAGIHSKREFGPFVRIIYVLSAFAGTMVASLFVRNQPVVGASGPSYGLIGAALSELFLIWRSNTDKFAALVSLLIVFVVNLVLGFLPYVDNFSSIGGCVTGILLRSALLFGPPIAQVPKNKGELFQYYDRSSIKSTLKQNLDWPALRTSVSIIIYCLVFAGCLVAMLRGIDMNKYCKWCLFIDCIPIRGWRCEDKVVFCESMVSNTELTLTYLSNENFRVFPFTSISQSRINDLCSVIC